MPNKNHFIRIAPLLGLSTLLVLFWSGLLSAACDPPTPRAGGLMKKGCVTTISGERDYRIFVPSSYDGSRAWPVVIGFHGGGDLYSVFNNYTRMADFADENNAFIAVLAQGEEGRHWNDGRYKNGSEHYSTEDIDYFDQLLHQLRNDVQVKEGLLKKYDLLIDKVYVIGMSNGGGMSLRLACERGKVLAGVAAVATAMNREMLNLNTPVGSACTGISSVPVPLLYIYNELDTSWLNENTDTSGRIVNPVRLGSAIKNRHVNGNHIGSHGTIEFWRTRNGCKEGLPGTNNAPNPKVINQGKDITTTVNRYTYSCSTPLVVYEVIGGGHRWPDDSAGNDGDKLGAASHEINSIDEIWEFFSDGG